VARYSLDCEAVVFGGNRVGRAESARNTPLNFKVSAEFRREFKTFAAQHNKKLYELLYDSFAALKSKHEE